MNPLVSCLCVTRNRPPFLPWLLWNFERQRACPHRELVLVDSSDADKRWAAPADDRIRIEYTRPNVRILRRATSLFGPPAAHLSHGWMMTTGSIPIASPPSSIWCRPATLASPARNGPGAWIFLADRCIDVVSDQILFTTALFRTELVRCEPFDVDAGRRVGPTFAEDRDWMQRIARGIGGRSAWLDQPLHFLLSHDLNGSSHRRWSFRESGREIRSLSVLRQLIGERAWQDTDEQLVRLRARLGAEVATPCPASSPAISMKTVP